MNELEIALWSIITDSYKWMITGADQNMLLLFTAYKAKVSFNLYI